MHASDQPPFGGMTQVPCSSGKREPDQLGLETQRPAQDSMDETWDMEMSAPDGGNFRTVLSSQVGGRHSMEVLHYTMTGINLEQLVQIKIGAQHRCVHVGAKGMLQGTMLASDLFSIRGSRLSPASPSSGCCAP